jgi:hypothetical protein
LLDNAHAGLAQAGVRVTVIEAEPKIINSPRAAVYFWSVLGGLGRLGILEDAEAAGVRKQDDAVLDRYSAARRDTFLNRVSPQATANKQLIYHANGGRRKLEEGLASLRRLSTDPEILSQRLMFTQSLETPPLLGPTGPLR